MFSQIERLAWHDEMISLMKVGQLCGHSCFKIETKTRFSLFKKARSVRSFSSELEFSMMKLTIKFRIPMSKDGRQLVVFFFSSIEVKD